SPRIHAVDAGRLLSLAIGLRTAQPCAYLVLRPSVVSIFGCESCEAAVFFEYTKPTAHRFLREPDVAVHRFEFVGHSSDAYSPPVAAAVNVSEIELPLPYNRRDRQLDRRLPADRHVLEEVRDVTKDLENASVFGCP